MSKSWKTLKITIDKLKASFILGCLFFVLIGAEAYGQLKKAPSWVREVPISDNAYYGVGIVSMKEHSEYRSKARKIALREIVEKIFVSVSSSSSLTTTYTGNDIDYLLDETVSLASSNFLSGHQKVNEWVDKRKDTYYVLFKLDISIYKENRQNYFESFATVIQLMQEEAKDLFKRGEIARSVSKLSQSINKLDKEINRLVEPEYGISLQKSRLTSIYELERQIDQITFNLERNYEFQADSRQPLVIKNFLVSKETGAALNGLMLNLKVIQGDVFRYSFDHENYEALSIYGLFPQKGVAVIQITAELMLEDKIRALLNPSVKSRLESRPIVIQFLPYTISFNFDKKIEPERLKDNSVLDYFRNITNDLGLKEVSQTEASYHIFVSRVGQVRKHQRGYYSGTLSVDITITDMKNEREIFHYTLPQTNVKVDRSEIAWKQAFNRSVNKSDKFLEGFITSLCALHF
ncbi:MAG: LPP20 family lipoprotein [Bacteroidota bacterium]